MVVVFNEEVVLDIRIVMDLVVQDYSVINFVKEDYLDGNFKDYKAQLYYVISKY